MALKHLSLVLLSPTMFTTCQENIFTNTSQKKGKSKSIVLQRLHIGYRYSWK